MRAPLAGYSDSPDSLPSPGQMLRRALGSSPRTPRSSGEREIELQSPSLHPLRARRAHLESRPYTPLRRSPRERSSSLFLSSDDVPELPAQAQAPAQASLPPPPPPPAPRPPPPQQPAARSAARTQRREEQLAALAKRQSLREANKIRHSKTDALKDMIVVVDSALSADGGILAPVFEQLRSRLEEHGATITTADGPRAILFERRVRARYNPDEQLWEPLDTEHIIREPTAMVLTSGEEAVQALEEDTLRKHIDEACARCDHAAPVQALLLIVGLDAYFRKQRASRNRAYAQAVRRRLQGGEPPPTQQPEDTQPERINSALLALQMLHRCHVLRIHGAELADYIVSIAGDIAIRPYRLLQQDAPRGIRAPTRGSIELMYRMMLEQIPRSTVHVARAVMSEYPTMRALFDAYARCKTASEAANMLAGLKCLNGRTSRNLGPSMSRRIHAIFSSMDGRLEIDG